MSNFFTDCFAALMQSPFKCMYLWGEGVQVRAHFKLSLKLFGSTEGTLQDVGKVRKDPQEEELK